MKKSFLFFWRLPKKIYNKINECEEDFLKKFKAEYKSKLAMHALIYHFALIALTALLRPLSFIVYYDLCAQHEIDGTIAMNLIFFAPTTILTITYIALYLKKRLPIIEGRKWWYCVQVILAFLFGGVVIIAPIYALLGLLVFAIYVLLALLVIWFILAFISVALGGSGGGKRSWTLSNGDKVKEEKGICGESYYTGASGKSYDTNDGGHTFYEK